MQIYSKKDARFIVGKKVYLRPLKKTDVKQGWLDWINDPNSLDNLFSYLKRNTIQYISYFSDSRFLRFWPSTSNT